ncbi:hypothetical protein C8F04DRAFT_1197195 [Mycena alexandri]|uniref:Uncharacterized protein n=1 Tax=Mycena alexandri TaxID=1745969 RepID=A0AAD6WP18_9AGAR|nr:hypothetical protein C8F04DRAFT_1197195 [Mycena alexandri]
MQDFGQHTGFLSELLLPKFRSRPPVSNPRLKILTIHTIAPSSASECGIEIDRRVNSAEVETKLILEVEQQLHVDVGGDRFHVNFGASFSLPPSCTARLYMLKALGWLRLDPEYSNDGSYMSATYSSETGFVFTALPYPPRAMAITAGPELLRLLNSTCQSTLFTASTSAQDSSVAIWLLATTSTFRRDRTNSVFVNVLIQILSDARETMFCIYSMNILPPSVSAQDSSVAIWLLAATSTFRRDRTNSVFVNVLIQILSDARETMFCIYSMNILPPSVSAQDSSVAIWLLAATSTFRRDPTNSVFVNVLIQILSDAREIITAIGKAKIASPGQKLGSRRRNPCCMTVENTWMWELVRAATTSWSCWTQTSVPVWESKVILEVEQQLHVVVGCDWLDGVEALGRCFGIAVKLRRSETVHVWIESGHGQREFTNAMKVDMVKGNSQQRSLYCWTWDRWRGKFDTGWVVGAGNVVPRAARSEVFNIGVGALGLARMVTDMMIERKRWALVSLQYKTQLGIDKGS